MKELENTTLIKEGTAKIILECMKCGTKSSCTVIDEEGGYCPECGGSDFIIKAEGITRGKENA